MKTDLSKQPFQDRAKELLSRVFGGMHHVYKFKTDVRYATCLHYGGLATFDFDLLTRLVLGAHEHCVRVEVSAAGPRRLKIMLHDRTRDGAPFDRHPDINEALA